MEEKFAKRVANIYCPKCKTTAWVTIDENSVIIEAKCSTYYGGCGYILKPDEWKSQEAKDREAKEDEERLLRRVR